MCAYTVQKITAYANGSFTKGYYLFATEESPLHYLYPCIIMHPSHGLALAMHLFCYFVVHPK